MIEVDTDDLEGTVSKFTGRDLRRVDATFELPEDEAEEIAQHLGALRSDGGVIADSEGGEWSIPSFSYRDGGWYRFTLDLVQHEQLQASTVEFGAFDLAPVYYEESLLSVHIVLAEFDLTDRVAEFRDFLRDASSSDEPTYFPVVRHGVVESPLEMRLGRCLWQRLNDSTERHQICFVAKSEDGDDISAPGHEPVQSNLSRTALEHTDTLAALIEELTAAGVLDPEAIERIKVRAEKGRKRHRFELYEARDLSHFRF